MNGIKEGNPAASLITAEIWHVYKSHMYAWVGLPSLKSLKIDSVRAKRFSCIFSAFSLER